MIQMRQLLLNILPSEPANKVVANGIDGVERDLVMGDNPISKELWPSS